jgi:hypothetical protein
MLIGDEQVPELWRSVANRYHVRKSGAHGVKIRCYKYQLAVVRKTIVLRVLLLLRFLDINVGLNHGEVKHGGALCRRLYQ